MYISFVMATKTSGSSPNKRRKYDEVFKAKALRLAGESRSTQTAARQLSSSPKLLYPLTILPLWLCRDLVMA
jgi:transposase